MDFRQYYDLESYLFNTVGPRFTRQGHLSAADFFCIVIWKANRAKGKIARRLLAQGYDDLDAAVHALTGGLGQQTNAKDRLRYLMEDWKLRLPMASAILTVFYPNDFTVYDARVCDVLGEFHNLVNLVNFDNLWRGYQAYKRAVEESAPKGLTLRDKDRYLWGKSFYKQLVKDLDGYQRRGRG